MTRQVEPVIENEISETASRRLFRDHEWQQKKEMPSMTVIIFKQRMKYSPSLKTKIECWDYCAKTQYGPIQCLIGSGPDGTRTKGAQRDPL